MGNAIKWDEIAGDAIAADAIHREGNCKKGIQWWQTILPREFYPGKHRRLPRQETTHWIPTHYCRVSVFPMTMLLTTHKFMVLSKIFFITFYLKFSYLLDTKGYWIPLSNNNEIYYYEESKKPHISDGWTAIINHFGNTRSLSILLIGRSSLLS